MKDFEYMVVSAVHKEKGLVKVAVTSGVNQLEELAGALVQMKLDDVVSVQGLMIWTEAGTYKTEAGWVLEWLIQEQEGLAFFESFKAAKG